MAKTNPGLMRASRLLNLVPFLTAHQGIDIDLLGREFHVSKSELLEDLNTLWMCGLPGYTPLELMDLAFESGFVTIRNAQELQKPRSLNKDEAVALLLGLDYLKGQIDDEASPTTATINALVDKLSASLRKAVAGNLHAQIAISAQFRQMLYLAIAKREPLDIEYHSATRDRTSSRTVHPFDILIVDGAEYVEAYCELSRDYRTFRIERILNIAISSAPQVWIKPESAIVRGKLNFEVEIFNRQRDVSERFNIHAEASQEKSSRRVVIQGFSVDWLVREIMALSGACQLTQPLDVRKAVKARAEKTLEAYKKG